MRAPVPQPLRRGDGKRVFAIAITGIAQVLPEPIRAHSLEIGFAVKNIHVQRHVRSVLVPSPAGDFLAIYFFQSTEVSSDLVCAEVAGKNQQTKTDRIKRQ